MAGLRHVDADLVRAAGLKPTLHERVRISKMLDRRDMRDCELAFVFVVFAIGRAAAAVTTIAEEPRANRALAHATQDNGQISSVRCVQTKLLGENSRGRHVSREGDEPACFAVDAMDAAHRWHASSWLRAGCLAAPWSAPQSARGELCFDRLGHELFERGLNLAPPRRPASLFMMPGRRDSRRLFDHHDVVVEMDNLHVPHARRFGRSSLEHLHHLANLQPSGDVGGNVAVDEHMATEHELLDSRPARAPERRPQKRGQRRARGLGCDVEDGPRLGFHTATLDLFFSGFTL